MVFLIMYVNQCNVLCMLKNKDIETKFVFITNIIYENLFVKYIEFQYIFSVSWALSGAMITDFVIISLRDWVGCLTLKIVKFGWPADLKDSAGSNVHGWRVIILFGNCSRKIEPREKTCSTVYGRNGNV